MEDLKKALEDGSPLRGIGLTDEEKLLVKDMAFLTLKTVLYCANVAEKDLPSGGKWVEVVRRIAAKENAEVVVISGKVESELIDLTEDDQKIFLKDLGLEEPGLNSLIRTGYQALSLITYFTAGEKEVRAWTIKKGATAPEAAGVIHGDFERGFIAAEIVNYDDLISAGSKAVARASGKMRTEGKTYIMQPNDVVEFRFNV
jgi:GTP-binding protein YchF